MAFCIWTSAIDDSATLSGRADSSGNVGKGGKKYEKHHGICLETQHFPDSINQPNFPPVLLKPGEVYTHETVHRFSVK